ncbi:hypothetical protein F7725_010973 [Dissostichus mawsoni]|uniref:Myosin motor domain-containing protein n=1 Tax=Dissostichus mawsoni TaxID=36200 RepID=A0A7J5Z7I0_DISMA|nr:hypothetical protein F7725_010973 [Dissostichus mawsoni]
MKPLWKMCSLREARGKEQQKTYIGSILAAVNPYQSLSGLYDHAAMELYSRTHLGEISPHIFAVANECYRSLWKRLQNQCVLIRLRQNQRRRFSPRLQARALHFSDN